MKEGINTAPVPELFTVKQDGEERSYVALPPGWEGEFPRDARNDVKPVVVQGARQFATTEAFATYFTRFETPRALVTSSRKRNSVTAELDYHLDAQTPEPGKHNVTRVYQFDRRFSAWLQKSGVDLKQIEFVEFLEDRLVDIADPDQGTLLNSIVQFKAFREANCASAVNLANGDIACEYTQVTRGAAGKAVLPERITIEVPVLEFERHWRIHARLRFRLNEGRLTFSYSLIGVDDIKDAAFMQAITDLSAKIGDRSVLLVD